MSAVSPIGWDPVTGRAIFNTGQGQATVVRIVRQTYTPAKGQSKGAKAITTTKVDHRRAAEDAAIIQKTIAVLQRQRETLLSLSKPPLSTRRK